MSRHDTIPREGEFNCWTRHFDLPDVILSICRAEESGLLRFVSAEAEKTLFINKGEIVFATSSSPDDRLGEYLLRTGRIRLKVLTELAKEVRHGKRLGAVLVERHVLSPVDLKRAVIEQVEAIVKSLVRWTDGWYGFNAQELPGREDIMIEKRTVKLILEAVRHIDSWRRVLKGVGDLDTVYHLATGQEATIRKLDLDAQALSLLAVLRIPQKVETICAGSELHDFEVCRLLWVFRSLGLIAQPTAEELAFPVSDEPGMEPEPMYSSEPVTDAGVQAPSEWVVDIPTDAAPSGFDSSFIVVGAPPPEPQWTEDSFPPAESAPPPPGDESPSEVMDPFFSVGAEPTEEPATDGSLAPLPLPSESDYSFTAPKAKPTKVVTDLPFQLMRDGAPTVDLHNAPESEVVEAVSEIIIDAESADIPFAMSPPTPEVDLGARPTELVVAESDEAQREQDLAFALGNEDYSAPPKSAPPPGAEAPLDPDLDLEGLGMVFGSDKQP